MNRLVKSLARRRGAENKGNLQSNEEGEAVVSGSKSEGNKSPRDDEASGREPPEFNPETVLPGLRWWTQTHRERRAKYDECRARAPPVTMSFLYEAPGSEERLHVRNGGEPRDRSTAYCQHERELESEVELPQSRPRPRRRPDGFIGRTRRRLGERRATGPSAGDIVEAFADVYGPDAFSEHDLLYRWDCSPPLTSRTDLQALESSESLVESSESFVESPGSLVEFEMH